MENAGDWNLPEENTGATLVVENAVAEKEALPPAGVRADGVSVLEETRLEGKRLKVGVKGKTLIEVEEGNTVAEGKMVGVGGKRL